MRPIHASCHHHCYAGFFRQTGQYLRGCKNGMECLQGTESGLGALKHVPWSAVEEGDCGELLYYAKVFRIPRTAWFLRLLERHMKRKFMHKPTGICLITGKLKVTSKPR